MRNVALVLTVGGALAAGAILAAQAALPAASDKGTAIQGAWVLNKDMSDRPEKGDERGPGGNRGGGPGGGSPGGRGGMGGGMPGGMGGGMPGGVPGGGDRDAMKRLQRILQDYATPPDGLTIVQDGPMLIVTTVDGRPLKYRTDGKEELRLSGDGEIKSKTRWNGDQLVVDERIQDGPTVVRRYAATSDLRQLMVVVTIEGSGLPSAMRFHQVFDRKN